MSPQPPSRPHWHSVADALRTLLELASADGEKPVSLPQFADGYGALARSYVAAIAAEGRSSMRADAVARALDLTTPKSALLKFLER